VIHIAPVFVALMVAAGKGQESLLTVEDCDVGELYAFSKAGCEITLNNSSDAAIQVHDVRATSANDSAEPKALAVPPHGRAHLKTRIDSDNSVGFIRHDISFVTDEHGRKDRSASVTGFVTTVLDQPRPVVDLGVVRLGYAGTPSKSIQLTSHDVADLRMTRILEAPGWLDASIGEDGRTLTAAPKADASWGIHEDFLKAAVNAPQQAQVWVEVKADIHGEIVPGLNPYDMGVMRVGQAHEFHIALHSRSGRDVHVGKVELDGLHGTTEFDTCEKPTGNCRMLVLHVTDGQPGPIRGYARIELPDYHQRLNLALSGVLTAGDQAPKKADLTTAADVAGASGRSPASKAPQHASAANQEPPPGKGPLLRWTVANGQPIHGYQIFRAADEAGPFVLLNQKTIPSIAKTEDSISYQYRDNTAKSGKTYWYYIGLVYDDGHKQQLSGPQKFTAK
jgi:hypothetical protein